MKKKILSFMLVSVLCLGVISLFCACTDNGSNSILTKREFSSGSGTQDDPYIIGSDKQWANISKHLDSAFELACDINLGDYQTVNPIGNAVNPFTGTFDGKGFSVNSAKIFDNHSVGLFGVTSGAVIKNLGLINSSVCLGNNFVDGDYAGSFVAIAKKGTVIENCYSKKINLSFYGAAAKWAKIGGFAGSVESMSSINYCSCNVHIVQANNSNFSSFFIGGFARTVSGSVIDCCYTTGSIILNNFAATNQMRIGTFVDYFVSSKLTNMYADMTINVGSNIDVYSIAGYVDVENLEYCLNFCDYQRSPKSRYEKCDLLSNASEDKNIYFLPSQYDEANLLLKNSLWQNNKYWEEGRLYPELVSYEDYLKIKQQNQD